VIYESPSASAVAKQALEPKKNDSASVDADDRAYNHLLLVAIDKQRVVTFKAVSAADGGDSDFRGGSTDKSRLNDAEYRRGLNDSSAAMSTGREQ